MIELLKSIPSSRLKHYLATSFSHLTGKKLINVLKTEFNLSLRKKKLSSLPYFLTVDLANFCQLRCPLCATGQRKHDRLEGKMNLKTFKKIIDEIGDYLLSVYLTWWGEPFLNPDILKFVNYAHERNIGTFISTNFSFPFDDKKIEEIIKSGLDLLIASLDGVTPDVYNKYRVGGNFNYVTNNLKLLTKLKKGLGSNRPFIEWQFLVNKYNEHQVPKLQAVAKELGVDSLVLEEMVILYGESKHDDINPENWLPKNKKYQPKGQSLLTNKSDNIFQGNCWYLWRGAAISPDGGVSPCCYNNSKKEDFGNILKDSFEKIWNNEKYLSARSLFRGERGSSETLCRRCPIANLK